MEQTTKDVLEATFTQFQNDLFWKAWTPIHWEGNEPIYGEKLEWSGYNDNYWWMNVAPSLTFCNQTDSKGRIWQLEPKTNKVTLLNQ